LEPESSAGGIVGTLQTLRAGRRSLGSVIGQPARPGSPASGRRVATEAPGRKPLASLYALYPEARWAPRELGLRFVPVEEIRGTAVAGATQRAATSCHSNPSAARTGGGAGAASERPTRSSAAAPVTWSSTTATTGSWMAITGSPPLSIPTGSALMLWSPNWSRLTARPARGPEPCSRTSARQARCVPPLKATGRYGDAAGRTAVGRRGGDALRRRHNGAEQATLDGEAEVAAEADGGGRQRSSGTDMTRRSKSNGPISPVSRPQRRPIRLLAISDVFEPTLVDTRNREAVPR